MTSPRGALTRSFELVDRRDYPPPHLDEPMPASLGQYANDHTKEWAQKDRLVRRVRDR